MSELLKEYDERTKRREFRRELFRLGAYALGAMIAAVYFSGLLFGQSSLETLLSLEATKKELGARIAWLKAQNAAAQKDYFELKGLYPNENK